MGFLRHYAALFVGLGALNWLARNAEASAARRAIVIADVLAFGLAAVLDVVAVAHGAGLGLGSPAWCLRRSTWRSP